MSGWIDGWDGSLNHFTTPLEHRSLSGANKSACTGTNFTFYSKQNIFAGSAVPQTGSCLREIMPLSRYIQTFVPRYFFHQQRTLEDFSPVLLWQKKSYLTQFTLVKQKVSKLTLHSVIWGGGGLC